MNKHRPNRISHIALGLMIGALLDGPQSIPDLIEASGLCQTTVRHYIAAWRKQRVVRVAEWQPDARNRLTMAAFAFGRGRDAVRQPAKRDNAGRMRECAERDKAHRLVTLMSRVAA